MICGFLNFRLQCACARYVLIISIHMKKWLNGNDMMIHCLRNPQIVAWSPINGNEMEATACG